MVLYTPNAPIIIDPTQDTIYLAVENVEEYSDWAFAVPVHVEESKFSIFGLHTCVSYLKRAIGLNKWWILTPYQLFKELKRGRIQ